MRQRRSGFVQQLCVALLAGFAAWPALAGGALPAIAFTPGAPTSHDIVTANLPFQICAWTVVSTPARVDINYQLAPCSATAFTDRVPLGTLAPGSYTVALNLLSFQGAPATQAIGTLGVTAAVDPTPALRPASLLLLALALLALATARTRAWAKRARIR